MLAAIESGVPEAVPAVLRVVRHDVAVRELTEMRVNDRQQLETLVMLSAFGGKVEMFNAVLRALRSKLTEAQVGR